jgi:hypothetical protein
MAGLEETLPSNLLLVERLLPGASPPFGSGRL